MKWKSTSVLFVSCSLTIFSWLILVEAHPADNKNLRSPDDQLAFSTNELPGEATKPESRSPLTRNKRTIGFLRQLFPGISQIIDRKIQQITRILFRVVGRLILRGGGDGNSGGDSGGGDRKISITLPTYPPSEDDEDETETPTEKDAASTDLPDSDAKSTNTSSTESSTGNSGASSGDLSPAVTTPVEAPENNMIVRKSRDVSNVLPDTTLSSLDEEISSSTAESTTKRRGLFRWPLGRGGRGNSMLGNGSNGSGNFIFDLIQLIAGSGTTPEKDEEQNAPREERDDDVVDNAEGNDVNGGGNTGYNPEEDTSGIPGPLTRFALLVNRGIGNIVKDIILRLAQTGERIVNYKARLITAII